MNKDTQKIVECWEKLVCEGINKNVEIDHEALTRIAETHARGDFLLPKWNMRGLYPQSDWTFAVNQIISNAFNFCFNIFEVPDAKYEVFDSKGSKPYRGALAMQRKIYQHFGEQIIQANDLSFYVRSAADIHRFFADLTPVPFPELRYITGSGLMRSLDFFYQGNPMNLLESVIIQDENVSVFRAFNDGNGLVDRLIKHFPDAYGSDAQYFGTSVVRFNKRAQLVALLLHGRASVRGSVLPKCADIDDVGPIADYEVPRGLRAEGVLVYGEKLAGYVDNWKPIERHSPMEVEIRMATVVSCVHLLRHINEIRQTENLPKIHMGHLDYWLWQLGKNSSGRPHLVRTDAY